MRLHIGWLCSRRGRERRLEHHTEAGELRRIRRTHYHVDADNSRGHDNIHWETAQISVAALGEEIDVLGKQLLQRGITNVDVEQPHAGLAKVALS